MTQKKDWTEEPKREDYRSQSSFERALRKHHDYKRARYIWPKISLEERVWILEQSNAKNPGERAALEYDELNPTSKLNKTVNAYPRSKHRRDIYKAKLASSPRPRQVRIRKHERHLSERYWREERGL